MADKIQLKDHENHVDALTDQREIFKKACGSTKTPDGYEIPKTTNANVRQLLGWWIHEYTRARLSKPWSKDPAQNMFEKAVARIIKETKDADPDALYGDNHWFWNTILLKLAIYLQAEKSKPSPMSLFVEALEESVDDRIKDAREFIENAGEVASDAISAVSKAAEAVPDAGSRALSGVKTIAIIGGGVLGAAIIVPPIIRAMRD